MQGVLEGFFTIWVVIGIGALLAQLKILRTDAQLILSEVSFFVGSPALLGLMMSKADLGRVFSKNVLASLCAIICSALLYLLAAKICWPGELGHRVIGCFCASYVNAGNLGLPIAAYVLGDVTWIAPILLMQVAVLQPIGLALLDTDRARRGGKASSLGKSLLMPLHNPMTLATVVGLGLNLAGLKIPPLLAEPINMLAGLAVPTMLLAFGIALRLGGRPSTEEQHGELAILVTLKLIVMPTIAWAAGMVLQLDRPTLLAVTVIAGLPCAQNIFVHAVRYDVARPLARDAIFITTIASIPTIMGIAALVG